jgi:chromosome segregation protein
VALTIDNCDGALPIAYTEVSIARRMFREGAHEYEINGSSCRLTDIQELLSDSRIGREMHVIVGQGQLSEILAAKQEERRAFIEEAAGVLKHRKRREQAQRKLTATADNLTRLTDLTEELHRQLEPLGRSRLPAVRRPPRVAGSPPGRWRLPRRASPSSAGRAATPSDGSPRPRQEPRRSPTGCDTRTAREPCWLTRAVTRGCWAPSPRSAVAGAARDAGEAALVRIDSSLRTAASEREAVQARRLEGERELSEVRGRSRRAAGEVASLTETLHRNETLRAEAQTRVEALETRVCEEFGISGDDLVDGYGPGLEVPPGAHEVAAYEQARGRGEELSAPAAAPFDRGEQERRAKRTSGELARLGKVNPLALEEFAALEERYKFLSTQLEDLKATRADLQTVISDVDVKIREVFRSAFTDVAAEFETVFATLFPGGAGRLVLTDPDHVLASGVDVEARPPGKKVQRLSLLSGGEKSLVAVAMLVAIFRARPSPFYVIDEVEAALDDTNLARVLALLDGLRSTWHLLVVTHQKPTMEIADALYGVSMRYDGITEVISQRLASPRASQRA